MFGGWGIVGGIGSEEVSDSGMARDDDVLPDHGIPIPLEIGERH